MRALLALLCGASVTWADNWPGWRGPRGDGVSREADLPVKWSPTQNVRWKLEMPGRGFSTPVAAGNRLFLTTAIPTGKTAVP